jgi:hypothetical protein
LPRSKSDQVARSPIYTMSGQNEERSKKTDVFWSDQTLTSPGDACPQAQIQKEL